MYFSIITQAMTYAAMLLFFRNETGFGGNNGFTDFKRLLGIPIATPATRMVLFVLSGSRGADRLLRVLPRWLWSPVKFGRVLQAIRDAESRVMFTGYNPLAYKLAIWTLSAVMCGVAGALYVPQVGIINPRRDERPGVDRDRHLGRGGRARTLVSGRSSAPSSSTAPKSWFTVAFPSTGCSSWARCSSLVTLFLPQGMVGLLEETAQKEA